MRVVHVHRIGGIAGSENHLRALLPRLASHGIEPVMIALAQPRDMACARAYVSDLNNGGVQAHVLATGGWPDVAAPVRLAREFRRLRPQLVHTHLLRADVVGLAAGRLARVPAVVATRHNDDRFRRRPPLRPVLAWLGRRADHVVAISAHLERFCRDVEHIHVDALTRIYYGIDAGTPRDAEPEGDPVIGIIARLVDQKGHDVLLRAFAEVRQTHANVRLRIVGDGPRRGALESLARSLGIAGAVEFAGWVPDAAALMPAFAVFAHPSRWEGLGLVFLEAMAAGVPIVATRAGAIPELVPDGTAGLLCDVDDVEALAAALNRLLADPALRARMGMEGARHVRGMFSPDAMAREHANLYRHITARMAGSAHAAGPHVTVS